MSRRTLYQLVFVLSLSFGILFAVQPLASFAQETAPTPASAELFGTKQSHEAQIAQLQQQLLGEINAYRRADQAFRVSKQQYENLETLKSLEELVQATKQAMFERSRVLTTYMEILYFTLQDTDGVNLTFKDPQIVALEDRIAELKAHTATVEQATSRDDVNKLRDDFALLKPVIEDTSYRVMSLISIGELQAVHDKSKLILTDLESQLASAEVSALKKAERERAFAETRRSLEQVKVEIDEVNQTYAGQEDLVRKQLHERVLRGLSPVYSKLSQNLSYLAELLRV